jgi:hypothetical protein
MVMGATLRWSSVYGAKTYVVEQSVDGVDFHPVAYPSKAWVTILGLTVGTFYWFRVAANSDHLAPMKVLAF